MEGADGGAAGLRSSEIFSLISLRVCWEKFDFDFVFDIRVRSSALKVDLVLLEMSEPTESGEAERGCRGCDLMMPATHFYVDKKAQSALTSRCKDCISEHNRLYYQEKRRMGPCDEP